MMHSKFRKFIVASGLKPVEEDEPVPVPSAVHLAVTFLPALPTPFIVMKIVESSSQSSITEFSVQWL